MIDSDKHSAGKRLTEAYRRMLGRISAARGQAGKDTLPNLQRAVDSAKKTAVRLGELSREEAEKIGAYLKRDLHDAGKYFSDTRKEMGDWLRFDVRQVEERIAEMCLSVADRTRLELDRLGLQAKYPDRQYCTGERAAKGALSCMACGQLMHFQDSKRIPPCPKCHATLFQWSDESVK